MAPAGIEQAANKQSTTPTPTRFFPEWTQEDDSDVEIASIAQRQRVRFRAASVAGRQGYQSPPRHELPSRRDVSQEAHEIRVMLQERKLENLAKGLGAARSTFAHGVGAAVDAVAQGFSNSGSAAASAFAEGEGVAGAASAAAGAVSDGIHKGASEAAQAVVSAGGALASAVEDSVEDGSKTSTTTKYEAPSPTQEPPQVTETSPSPSSTYYNDPVPPEITDGPAEDVPPPKAEQPPSDFSSESGFSSSAESYSASSSDEEPTPTDDSQKISLSTLVPGATITGPSGTRLQLTPILTNPLPAATSGIKKGTTASNNDTTPPFAVAPDRTTMITSISPTSNMTPNQTGGPIADLNPNGPDREESSGGGGGGGGGGGLSTGGQDAVMSIGVLIAVSAAVAIAYFLWRRRKRIMNPDCVITGGGGGDSPKDLFKSTLGRTKQGLVNVARRIPYLRDKFPRDRENRWDHLGDPYGDYFTEKSQSAANAAASSAGFDPATNENRKLEPVTIQTSFTRTGSAASKFNSTAGVGGTFSTVGVSSNNLDASALGISSVAEANARAAEPGSDSRGQSPFADPADDTPISPTAMPPARSASQARHLAGSGHVTKPSLSSTALEYNLTLPSAPGGARRISDLSSLSSGFGDGDIFVPSKQARKSTTSSKLQNVMSHSDNNNDNNNNNNNNNNSNSSSNNRHSTATTVTTTTTRGDTRRDTVFTEASEDSPPRFRTVNSWVRQQSGRVKRAKQREQDAADESGTPPPVPAIPPEQDFRLMMPDGEVPRRVEDTETGEGDAGDWGSQTRSVLSGTIGAAR
ncbi:hypothetical protein ARSEF1564_009571 [Beauveria bassiana]